MYRPAVPPFPFMESVYQSPPRKRAAEHPGFVSLPVSSLFPEFPEAIYCYGEDRSAIRPNTFQALENVDMSMIKPGHRVHFLASEHGFSILGGWPYREMLGAIRDAVRERTGCEDIYLGVAAYRGFRESREVIEAFRLMELFEGRVFEFGPYDEGVAIDTEVGTLYGVKKAYDADWFVHSYYDDPREMYFHRFLARSFKAFAMSYARLETRSAYHYSYKNRSCNFLPVAIFRSPYVQERYAFSCIMRLSPAGIMAIDADNDLFALDRRITRGHLERFGKMQKLFESIEECIAVIDGGRWGYYVHAGGVTFGVLMFSNCPGHDILDLDSPSALMMIDEVPYQERENLPTKMLRTGINPALKAVVINQQWAGIPFLNLFSKPIFVVGRDQLDYLRLDRANPLFKAMGDLGIIRAMPDLQTALEKARRAARTDKVLVFDGSFGHLNLSPSLAEELVRKAPEVRRKVEEELLPRWLRQRNLE
ncbi:hypothetical protein [Candidatus Solincola tengchongensis]|uniref:hypothetical protein n=1 Tax=Candidatus Solincola tengchongensis TaxID=2900693 RepID=UPI00258024FA|nr:hypothetical protein [Candidatus Solincola tengchongensis]